MKLYTIRTKCYNIINYVYLIVNEATSSALVIDPSWNLNLIMEYLNKLQLKLSAIFLTHAHYDHVNLAHKLTRMTGANVYMSEIEQITSGFSCLNLLSLQDEDIIVSSGIQVKCLLTPGHTIGSMCYLINDSLFSGDTFFIEGCGICEKNSDAEQMYFSIQRLKKEISDNTYIYPGHCYHTRYGQLFKEIKQNNIYFNIMNINDFVSFRMRDGQKNLFKFI